MPTSLGRLGELTRTVGLVGIFHATIFGSALAGGGTSNGSIEYNFHGGENRSVLDETKDNALIAIEAVKFAYLPYKLVMDPVGTIANKTVFYVGELVGAFPSNDSDKNVYWEGAMALPVAGKFIKIFEPMVESPEASDPNFGSQ